jgi:hypothetical protein
MALSEVNKQMRNITTKTLMILCVVGLISGLAIASAAILAVSNIINVTVTPPPAPTITMSLTINGTSLTQYAGIVHPGDKLFLNATAISVPSGFVSSKTITFFNNAAYPIGTQTTDSNGVATLTWTVPALTTTTGNDVYAFRAELS